jgi:misacylated tRNA(Ala) deacylase
MNDLNENPKNYDPRMHSAEHILNQTMVRMFNCGRAFSAHIEKKKSKCDYRFDRALTDDETAEIERRVNEVIGKNLPIAETLLDRNEAATRFNLGRLPEEAGSTIRVITIGDYDACPCSGTHAASTIEIGVFQIASSDHANGVLRIRFKLHQGKQAHGV